MSLPDDSPQKNNWLLLDNSSKLRFFIYFQSGDGDDKMSGSATLTTAAESTSIRSPINLSILLSAVVVFVGVIFSYFYATGTSEDEEELYHGEKIVPPTK